MKKLNLVRESNRFRWSKNTFVFTLILMCPLIAFSQFGAKTLTFGNDTDLIRGFGQTGERDITIQEQGEDPTETEPSGIIFNNNGTKMYVVRSLEGFIEQYSLATAFDLNDRISYEGSLDVSAQDSEPYDLGFSHAGDKLYVLGKNTKHIYQYSLSTDFEITSGVSHDGTPLDISIYENFPTGFCMYGSGASYFYIIGNEKKRVYRLTLNTAFDITSGVANIALSFDFSNELSTPRDVFQSFDGKLYVLGSSSAGQDRIVQYGITTISNKLSTEILSIDSYIGTARSFHFNGGWYANPRGRFFIVGSTGDDETVQQFDLNGNGFTETEQNEGRLGGTLMLNLDNESFTNAGDVLTEGVDYDITNLPAGLSSEIEVLNVDKGLLYLFGHASQHQARHNFNLEIDFENGAFEGGDASVVTVGVDYYGTSFLDNEAAFSFSGGFSEVSITNDGAVEGELTITIDEGTFANADGTLQQDLDYTVTNLPLGLSSSVAVSADGLSATLTLSGNANNHQDADDVASLLITFNESALFNYTAEGNYSTNVGIDFQDNNPALYYGNAFDLTGSAAVDETSYELDYQHSEGIVFSADGSKMFILENANGTSDDEIQTYTLTTPFDLSTATLSHTFDFSTTVSSAFGPFEFTKDIYFTQDGLTLIISSRYGFLKYTLSTAYDLSGGLTFDGSQYRPNFFSNGLTNSLLGCSFSEDGYTLVGLIQDRNTNGWYIQQLSLDSPFDVTGTFSEVGTFDVPGAYDIAFSPDGLKMFLTRPDDFETYELTSPFDVVGSASQTPEVFDRLEEGSIGDPFTFGNDGTKLYIVKGGSGINDYVISYDLNGQGFVETGSNDGSVEGAMTIILEEDVFVNAGASLSVGTHFTISNLPAGLIPEMTVAGDGLSVVLTLNGNATDHDNLHDVENLIVTFLDAAFILGNANAVANNGNTTHGFGIDFFEGPSIRNQTFDLDENSTLGTAVGTIVASGDGTLTLSITAGNDLSAFELDEESGELTVVDPSVLDFETNETFSLTVEVSDGSLSASATITVDLNDVSEAPTDLELGRRSIEENNVINAEVGTFRTTDEDTGETYTYTLVAGTGSTDNSSFNISGSQLRASEIFDFETKTSYSIRVQTDDGNGGTYAEVFTITITNDAGDDNVAPTDISLSASSIEENNAVNDVIGSFSTTDANSGDSHTYILVAGTGSTDNASFNLSSNQLRASEAFDFETKTSYSIRVQTDDGNGGTYAEAFTITITNDTGDDNVSPTDITLSANSIEENNAVNDVIGSFSTTDANSGDSHTYTLVAGTGSTDNASFNLSSNQLRASEVFDFETKTSYSIRVQTDDGNGGTYAEVFTITITDEMEVITWDGSFWSNGTGPTSGEDALIAGNYTFSAHGSFEVSDLTIASGATLTVDGEATLTIQGDLQNNGDLIVESGASFITYESNSLTGEVIFKRNTRYADGKYSMVGTPMEQSTTIMGSDLGSHVYKFDEAEPFGADGSNRWKNAHTDELVPGKGYTQAFQQELIFEGTPNVGTVTYAGTFTDESDNDNEGWNLISNPYTAAIGVTDFLNENTNMEGAVYIWDDNGSDLGQGTNADYIVANGIAATNTTPAGGQTRYNQTLGSAQGFFVKLLNDVDTEVVFQEGMREMDANGDDHFFRETESILRINLTNEKGLFKQAVIGFREDASETSLVRAYDAPVFDPEASDLIYTIKQNKRLAIQAQPDQWEIINLGVNLEESGTYTLSLEGTQEAYLLDQLTGAHVDLGQEAYAFTSTSGSFTDRFSLLSRPEAVLGIEYKEPLVYLYDRVLHIISFDQSHEEYRLINLNGKVLQQFRVSKEASISLSHLSRGVYIVSNGQTTTKIILN